MKTLTNRVIGLVLALAMIAAFVLVPMPMDIKAQAATVTSTNLVDNIQDGVTLQCWNWSIANIKANLGLIANMGYSAIQVSPMQEMKEGTVNKPVNNWWAVYQPISFYINKSQSHCVGTKDELIDLCTEAHKYGIKVIMDVVFNHTANNGANQLCPMVDPDFLNDPACWHDYSQNSSSYNDRYDVTQRCMAGLPDINTGNQKVQDKALALMKEYVDCGVDGFRFDAAKQIETPDDHSSYASDFWPTVVNGTTSYAQSTRGFTPYYYGELLQDTDNYGSLPISAYTKYMSATESVWSNDIRYKMEEHNASALRKAYFKDAPADKLVLWAESHDTIGDLSSLYSSDYVRNKAWALAASRAYTMALYFPRSNDMTNIDPNAKDRIYQEMGELAKLGWSSEFTKQVNYFHNHFAGQSEYLTQDTGSNLYYNERGNSGVIITNFNDGGRDINLPVYAMASGTYYDQLTGNKFTVSGGRIYGTMGDTGVAVVYNPSTKSCSHSSHGADGYCYSCYAYVGHKSGSTCSTCGTASTRTIYFINSKNWTTPYIYGWHDVAGEATASWPGTKMTKVEGSIWSAEIPTTATNIIFNDNAGNQTANLVPSASDDTYDIEFGYWSTRGEVVVADNYYLFYTTNSGAYNGYDYRFVDGKLTMSFAETSYVWIIDSNGVQYMCDGWPGEVTSATMKTLNSMSGTPDKLPVPHSKELTFTMSFNTDGSLNLSYTVGGAASGGAGGGSTGGGTTTTTKTIYFTNTSNWSSVNVYAWNGNGDCTGSWPGSAMTSVGNNVYSYNVPSDAVNIIFNNGNGSQTSDLTIPTDSKNHYTGSAWTTYTSGGSTGGSTGGDVTGGDAPDNTYYLFWGNGSGSLSHNEWDTPFVGGKATVTFDETMYVWVITNQGGIQYMTDGWQGNVTSVKLYPQPQLTNPNKLVVPAGTQTLTLSENSDGSLTLAYGAGNSGNTGGSTGGSTGGNTGGTTTTTNTIYFTNTSSWSSVYVYAWNGNGDCTGSWPGSAMTSVGNNVYSYNVPSDAVNIIFNNGNGSQTSDLTIPTDGKNHYTGSAWTTYTSGGSTGGDSGSTGGDVTGGNVPDNTYYLFWGNSSGSLSHNEWDTPFVGGKTTVTFDETMYVWVITNQGGIQYMTDGWQGNVNSVKLYPQPQLTEPNKLVVPAGTQTLTLSDNGDGSLTLAYGAGNSGNTGGSTGGSTGGTTTDTKTIYFDCGSAWSKANVYAWDDGTGEYTGGWPGSSMTALGNGVYSYEVPTAATKIIFNDGTSQTSDMVIPTDGKNLYTLTSDAWSTYTTGGGNQGGSTTTAQYVQVTDLNEILSGGEFMIAVKNGNTYRALSQSISGMTIAATGITVNGNVASGAPVFTVKPADGGVIFNVNGTDVSFGGSPAVLVIAKGSTGFTVTAKAISSYGILYNIPNDQFMITTVSNAGSVNYISEALFFKYTEVTTGCDHSYTSKVTTAATCDKAGVKTYTCSKCGDSYTESIAALGHSYTSKVTTAATCTTAGVKTFTCGTCGNSYTESIAALGHNFVGGTCTVCGATDGTDTPDPGTTYYLVGWINGADYGCESDYENMGQYKFVNGKLSVKFDSDSYVFVKTEGNGKWLLAEAFCELTSCTFVEGGTEKMYIPGGVQLTLTLVENADGSVTISYTQGGTTSCDHSYTSEVTTAATCTTAGVKTYTCSKCGSSYTESIPMISHNFVSGNCTYCGAFDPSTALSETYYLVGWINGADYGCESDYENNGIYKFVNGQLSVKFDQDSYIFVKTENNGKWLLADAYCEAASCTFKVGGTEKMFVPGGVQLIFSIVENADGSVTVTYTEGSTSACTHSYTAEVTTAATCTDTGIRTYTCSKCGDSYTQVIPATGHSFFDNKCTVCGAADPNANGNTYYLVGYINGADYGCEDDFKNMGDYKFVDGKLTVKFDQDSYVFVKTEGNTQWLLSTYYCEASTCVFVDGGNEKMFVPGGVELNFTLTENANGGVTLTYTNGSTPASTVPTLTLKSPTLEFKDMITVNAFYTAENIEDVVEMGMITYSSQPTYWSIRTADYVIPGYSYVESTGRYYSASQGIHAKYLADTVYLAVYAKLADGSYAYSKLAPYSPVTYANSQLKNSTNASLKQLVVAMLNYGAEAQLFFGHNTGNLANATLTAEQLALPSAYNSSMVSAVPAASATKQGSFANNSGFSKRYPAISFEGAFCINYFFTPNYEPANGITLYYWNAEDYAAASVLTTSNATGSLKMNGTGTNEYRGDITGIAAKEISEAVYVAAAYKDASGTVWTSGVLGYSIGAYCSSQASKAADISELAKATAVYGYHAKQYFG